MDDTTYVRGKLEEAKAKRGRLAQIARETQTDQRTMRTLMDGKREPLIATVDKLLAYFRKEEKKASKEAARHAGQ